MTRKDTLNNEIQEAADKAIDSLARYKFVMFGYWAGVWVHLNRLGPMLTDGSRSIDIGNHITDQCEAT